MSPEPTVLAYLAGVIDSDGYITIHRSCRKGVLYHAPQVGIAGTRTQPHQLAASIWGGNVNRYEPKNPRHRAQFQWVRYGQAAVEVIAAIAPFLRVKAEQAALAMELGEHLLFGQGDDPAGRVPRVGRAHVGRVPGGGPMIPFWLYAVATVAATALIAGAVGYCLGSAQARVDRILAEELRRPLVNDQKASDRGSDGHR